MTTKHIITPLVFSEKTSFDREDRIVSYWSIKQQHSSNEICMVFSCEEDAAFIVKAVNAHDDLVAALLKILFDQAIDENGNMVFAHPHFRKIAKEALDKTRGGRMTTEMPEMIYAENGYGRTWTITSGTTGAIKKTKYTRADLVAAKLAAAEKMAGALKFYADGEHVGDMFDVGSCGVATDCLEDGQRAREALAEWQKVKGG